MRRRFNSTMPLQQRFVQGRNSFGTAIDKNIKAHRTVQPGNTFNKVIRPEYPPPGCV